jgi:ABC-2 type transport system permease protein
MTMLRSVFTTALWSRRRSLVWWTGGSFIYVFFLGSVFPTVRNNAAGIDALMKTYPEALKKMFGLDAGISFTSGAGFLHMELFSFIIPLLLLVFAVGFGARAVAGEEEEGTLDLVLSGPISRRSVFVQQYASMLVTTAVLGLAMLLAILLAGSAFGMGLDPGKVAAAVFVSVLIALVFGSLALAVGAASGRRGLTVGVAGAAALASYLVFSLADMVSWLGTVQKALPWYYYAEAKAILNGLNWAHAGVMVAFVAALPMVALVWFERRDLAV